MFREVPDALSAADLDGAVTACGEAIEEIRAEGDGVAYLGTEVLLGDDQRIGARVGCFEGENRVQIEEPKERAGVPFTGTYRRGTPIPGEREKQRV